MHDKDRWKATCAWGRKKPRCYFLGMGDYLDLASTSERLILGNPALHESTKKTLEQLYLDQVKGFCKDIEFMRGRLIGICGGNHYGMFPNGTTTDQKIAELMGCKYLGVSSLMRVTMRQVGTKHRWAQSVDIMIHHGRGTGRTVGGSINAVVKLADVAEADIYLMGDNHAKEIAHRDKLRLGHGGNSRIRLRHRKRVFARTGSYLKGYEEDCESYIVDGAMPPSELGSIKLELTPRRDMTGGDEFGSIDVHGSI